MNWSGAWARLRTVFLLCLAAGAWQAFAQDRQPDQREVPVISLEGAIGPATSDYVVKEIARAGETGAPLVIIRMDTPGGLDTSMREIIRAIVNSPIPVVTYVGPSGARAASAGAFILVASHVAAMAPGTNVGAATPVQLGAPGGSPSPAPTETGKAAGGDVKTGAKQPASASEAKALNDAIAYIRSLAEMRGRNADWAEAAVREAASLSAQAALKQDVIDLVARDTRDLLAQLDGRAVRVGQADVILATADLGLKDVEPDWRTRLLVALTDPNIALILMMLGAYGLLFEFMNPGAMYPGIIGGISLLIGLYALSALPVNYAGIALILLGMGLMSAEAFAPSFGILGIGGIVAFILGGAIMFDSDLPEFRVALPVLAAVGVAGLGLTFLTARLALRSRRGAVATGREQMVGASGTVIDWTGLRGHVHVHGERWRAVGPDALAAGQPVRVLAIDGLTLAVEPVI